MDPNPSWTRAPCAGVPQPGAGREGASAAPFASAMPPPPPRPGGSPSAAWGEFFERARDVAVGEDTFCVYEAGRDGPLLLCLHGAGYSALTWAFMARALTVAVPCRVAAMDLRGHGASRTAELDYSCARLTADVAAVAAALQADAPSAPLVLVGHSLGGAIACHLSRLLPALGGLVLLDVVEGTALASREHTVAAVAARPTAFADLPSALAWALRAGVSRNATAAAPSLAAALQPAPGGGLVWRTSLAATEPFWESWFIGIGDAFLTARCPKLLLLCGTERLDAQLTLAQMQGRFQLVLVPQAGHAIQEDEHARTADALAAFLRRFVP